MFSHNKNVFKVVAKGLSSSQIVLLTLGHYWLPRGSSWLWQHCENNTDNTSQKVRFYILVITLKRKFKRYD